MIRHVALFRLKTGMPAGTQQALEDGLFLLAQTIQSISAYHYGPDLSLKEGNFDFAVVADFEDETAYRTYADHPAHVEFIKEQVAPVISERAALQFEI